MSCALPTVPARSAIRWYANIMRIGRSRFDDLEEPAQPRTMRVLRREPPADAHEEIGVALGTPEQIEELLVRIPVREPQLKRLRPIDLGDVTFVEHDQGDRARAPGLAVTR